MAEFAKVVRLVVDAGGKAFLFVDGQEFPYHIHADSIETVQHGGELPYVRFSLMAERIETVLDYTQRKAEDSTPSLMGSVFRPAEQKYVDDSVLAFLHQESEDGEALRYLVRSRDGDWNWGDHPNDVTDRGFTWSDMSLAWKDDSFRVVKVRD